MDFDHELRTMLNVNCYSAYAMLQWACASIGALLVTLNPAYRLNELVCRHQLPFLNLRKFVTLGLGLDIITRRSKPSLRSPTN